MTDINNLESQLHKIMEKLLSTFTELNQTDQVTLSFDQIQTKANEIVKLSKSLDESIENCNTLKLSKENLEKDINFFYEEKKTKLEEFHQVLNESGMFIIKKE